MVLGAQEEPPHLVLSRVSLPKIPPARHSHEGRARAPPAHQASFTSSGSQEEPETNPQPS